jgi:hypothetical protein
MIMVVGGAIDMRYDSLLLPISLPRTNMAASNTFSDLHDAGRLVVVQTWPG